MRNFPVVVLSFALVASCVSAQKLPTPIKMPDRPQTPQEVLLLFSGDTADERLLLTLNNNRDGAMTTGVTVYTASGESTDLAPIAMVPNESKLVELSPLLKAAGLGSLELGWVKLSYSGITMEMGAQLTVYPGDGQIGVDSPRSLSSDFKSTQRAAAFWVPRGGSVRLALANHSTTSIFVKVNCDLLAEELVIPASSTKVKVITLPDLGPFGGAGAPLACELSSNGAVDALRPVGTVSAPGYSTPVRFYDPTTATFPSLTAVGLQTRAETHITVHNVTDQPIVFTPVLRQATLDSPQVQRLPARPLPPHATESVDVSAVLAGFSGTGMSLATLTLQSAAPKGAFIGSVSQVGGSDHLIEDIPLRTSNPPAFARGSYPLRWDQDYTNQVTVANTSDKALRIGGSITAGTMVYVFERKDIEPGSTILLDVDKWRRERTPDVNGKLLPLDAPFGKIHWIEMRLGKNAGLLGRQSLASVENNRRSSFSCGSTCTYTYDGQGFYDPLPWRTFSVGDSLQMRVEEHVSMVNGSSYVYPSNDNTIFTESSGIVSLSSSTQNGSTQVTETATSPGSVAVDFTIYADQPTYDPDMEQCDDNYSDTDESNTSDVGSLTCSPQVVTRGGEVTCTAQGGGQYNVTFANWTFTGDSGVVTSTNGSSYQPTAGIGSWSGTVVQGGVVQVTATFLDGASQLLTGGFLVDSRSNTTSAASPQQVANGTFLVLPVPPAPNGDDAGLGESKWQENPGALPNIDTVVDGPNAGFLYLDSPLTFSTIYQYEINPDLDNTSSVFYQAQTGSYNAASNPNGTISGANLAFQTRRHEYAGLVQSHYAEWKAALAAYNPGDKVEALVGGPGTTTTQYQQNINNLVQSVYSSINTVAQVQPFGVDYSETGQFLGYVCYSPYTSCQ